MSDLDRRKIDRRRLKQKGVIVCSDGTRVPVLIDDVSLVGFGVLSESDAEVGAKLPVEINLIISGEKFEIKVLCEVKYTLYVATLQKYRIGMKFESFVKDAEARLTNLMKFLPPV